MSVETQTHEAERAQAEALTPALGETALHTPEQLEMVNTPFGPVVAGSEAHKMYVESRSNPDAR